MTEGAQNVFADLGLPDADELLAKARLASTISDIITGRHLTQAAAAELLGATQPNISNLVNGRLEGFSLERLARFLIALEDGSERYSKIHHIIRNRLYHGLVSGRMPIGSILENERLKKTLPQVGTYGGPPLAAESSLVPQTEHAPPTDRTYVAYRRLLMWFISGVIPPWARRTFNIFRMSRVI